GEIDDLSTFFGDGDTGNGDVDVAGLQSRDYAVEIHGVQVVIKACSLGAFGADLHIETDHFTGFLIHHFKWNEAWIGDYSEGFRAIPRSGNRQWQTRAQSFQPVGAHAFSLLLFCLDLPGTAGRDNAGF